MKKVFTSVLLGSAVFTSVPFLSSHADDAVPAAESAPAQTAPETITIGSSSVGSAVVLGGTVMPDKIINLSAQMPGDVNYIAGYEGDAFKKGDALVGLDTAALRAKREQAVSQLASAEAGYRNSLVQYNRELYSPNSQSNSMLGGAPSMFSFFSDPAREMMGQGDPSYERHSSLYGQGVQIETARNSVDQARAGLRELDESLENAVSYAPFDGVIVKKMVEKGDIVQPGMPLVSFADLTKLQIRVEVPTNLLKVVKAGGQIKAKLDANSGLIDVAVDRIFPMADPGGHTTTVKFNLPAGTEAHSGMYAEILIPDPRKSKSALPVIPETAILWRGSLPAVFQVTEDGSTKLRLIRIGDRSADGQVSVISGVKVGDKILVKPAANVRSGS